MEILNLEDLRDFLRDLADRADELGVEYGNITKASVGSVQRSLLVLEQQGGNYLFGEPVLDLDDLMLKDRKGRGYISVLAADKLMESPRLYATFLLFLLSELFEKLDEVGDPDKPKLVFFFDEAHLLFRDAPKALLEKVEQVVRLIRSKGVGVYFVTQNPLDVPDTVSRQLGNRVQHALRAFSPLEQKAVKAAATTFRANPDFDTEKAIMELGIGEALISTLDPKGQPTMVERTMVKPPNARVGPITDAERKSIIGKSPVKGDYDKALDRESAHETLQKRMKERAAAKAEEKETTGSRSSGGGSRSDGFWTSVGKVAARSVVPMVTRVLENMLKSKLKGGRGGGFGGYGALDTGTSSASKRRTSKDSDGKAAKAEKTEKYVPFQTIPPVRGVLGGIQRRR